MKQTNLACSVSLSSTMKVPMLPPSSSLKVKKIVELLMYQSHPNSSMRCYDYANSAFIQVNVSREFWRVYTHVFRRHYLQIAGSFYLSRK